VVVCLERAELYARKLLEPNLLFQHGSTRRNDDTRLCGSKIGSGWFSDCTFILYRYSYSRNATADQVSMLSPLPSFPSVDWFLGTTFSEKSTCFVPWWMLDELITSMSSQT
jgi:hypothetical protein